MGKYTEVCRIVFDEKLKMGKGREGSSIVCTKLELNEMIHKAIGLKLGFSGDDLALARPYFSATQLDEPVEFDLATFEIILELNLKSFELKLNNLIEKLGQ